MFKRKERRLRRVEIQQIGRVTGELLFQIFNVHQHIPFNMEPIHCDTHSIYRFPSSIELLILFLKSG